VAKTRVGILCGGKSAEHEVSLQSAKNVVEAIDKEQYEVVLLALDKQGRWYLQEDLGFLVDTDDARELDLSNLNNQLGLIPGDTRQQLIDLANSKILPELDVVFPILHGPYGEDGTMQGLLKLLDVPFVGPGVLGSAVGMDKDVMKRLIKEAGIPTAPFLVYDRSSADEIKFAEIKEELGLPVFVKPANLGSSVGVSKADDKEEFTEAVELAFQFDNKLIIEEEVTGREIECSVLGNDDPVASLPGEILPHREFYSYEAKYIDEEGAGLDIPADLSDELIKEVQHYAVKTFNTLCCEGLSRVDVFITEEEQVLVNEINTIPGFTRISMYPKLWEVSGISYPELIDRLLQLGIKRYEQEQKLKTTI
jgi:D-alanine-D-alanine ligase